MDVYCSTCGEPWDVYHLRHDAIFETDLSPAEAEAWRSLSRHERPSPEMLGGDEDGLAATLEDLDL
jgi:hypothetical protein